MGRADPMRAAMSACEIAKRLGSIGAASGGSISRRMRPVAKFMPLKALAPPVGQLEKIARAAPG